MIDPSTLKLDTISSRTEYKKGVVKLQYVPTNEQVVDILTKGLPKGKFEYFREKMGVVENPFLTKREC